MTRSRSIGCFVHDLLSKHDSRAIIQAVVQLAGSLGIKTTAEGVETQGELDYLKRVGCTEAQGYLLSKPVPAKEVTALLEGGSRKPRRRPPERKYRSTVSFRSLR